MHLKQLLPILVGTAAAIDVYINAGNDCQGSYSLCQNLPPNLCCGVIKEKPGGSVAFLPAGKQFVIDLPLRHGGGRDRHGRTSA